MKQLDKDNSDERPSPEEYVQFQAAAAARMHWATLSVKIQEISEENKQLVSDLSIFDPQVAIPLISGLLTLPDYQTQCIRLEVLVALGVIHCKGRKKPSISDLVRWYGQISESQCVIGEDPAEDVFVALTYDKEGDYRILEGVWESAGFYTQCVYDVVSTMPDRGEFHQTKRSFRALLVVSDIVCQKSGCIDINLDQRLRINLCQRDLSLGAPA